MSWRNEFRPTQMPRIQNRAAPDEYKSSSTGQSYAGFPVAVSAGPVCQLLLAGGIDIGIVVTRILSHDHPLVDFGHRVDEKRASGFEMEECIGRGFAGTIRHKRAGGAARAILEEAGIHDVLCKSLGSANHINVARATIDGLRSLKRPDEIAALRGLDAEEFVPAGLLEAYKTNQRDGAPAASSKAPG